MHVGSLERLVETARALPGERVASGGATMMSLPGGGGVSSDGQDPSPSLPPLPLDLRPLRARLGVLLGELARRMEPAMEEAMRRAEYAWDQFDALHVMDPVLRAEASLLTEQAAALALDEDPARRATGLELHATLDAAIGIVTLCERRLATLVRLRLRSDDPSLLVEGRPFLDVAAALGEAARGWA